jgi:hypothetical protein
MKVLEDKEMTAYTTEEIESVASDPDEHYKRIINNAVVSQLISLSNRPAEIKQHVFDQIAIESKFSISHVHMEQLKYMFAVFGTQFCVADTTTSFTATSTEYVLELAIPFYASNDRFGIGHVSQENAHAYHPRLKAVFSINIDTRQIKLVELESNEWREFELGARIQYQEILKSVAKGIKSPEAKEDFLREANTTPEKKIFISVYGIVLLGFKELFTADNSVENYEQQWFTNLVMAGAFGSQPLKELKSRDINGFLHFEQSCGRNIQIYVGWGEHRRLYAQTDLGLVPDFNSLLPGFMEKIAYKTFKGILYSVDPGRYFFPRDYE